MPKFRVEGEYRGFSGTGYASRTVEAETVAEARDLAHKPGFWDGIDFISLIVTGSQCTGADAITDIYEVPEEKDDENN
jgi:hypothetical protein